MTVVIHICSPQTPDKKIAARKPPFFAEKL
jgi:hypothetical protein